MPNNQRDIDEVSAALSKVLDVIEPERHKAAAYRLAAGSINGRYRVSLGDALRRGAAKRAALLAEDPVAYSSREIVSPSRLFLAVISAAVSVLLVQFFLSR